MRKRKTQIRCNPKTRSLIKSLAAEKDKPMSEFVDTDIFNLLKEERRKRRKDIFDDFRF